VCLKALVDSHREHTPSILLTLPAPNENLVPLEVEVLHAQLETLLQAQPRSVKERDDQRR
jgi:hypothetical protein